jgi:hypothetical protein
LLFPEFHDSHPQIDPSFVMSQTPQLRSLFLILLSTDMCNGLCCDNRAFLCILGSCGEMMRGRGQEEPKQQKNERSKFDRDNRSRFIEHYARKHAHKIAQAEHASRWGLWDRRSE